MSFDDLLKKYPNAFRYPEEKYSFYYFGFQCKEGWIGLLEPVAEYLNTLNSSSPVVYIAQVKEKFGGLRIYVHGADDTLNELIRNAETKSFKVCDECGNPGTTKNNKGWLRTRCFEHEEKL
ncbi:MAG: hypothetical protein EB116_03475 [Betaproteobacteria bacterium]|nr:hypothetical protein [Betaproteobacteria bacterium]